MTSYAGARFTANNNLLQMLLLVASYFSCTVAWSPPLSSSTTLLSSSTTQRLAHQARRPFLEATPSPVDSATTQEEEEEEEEEESSPTEEQSLFDDFVDYLLTQQSEIIESLEDLERQHGSDATFSSDTWGLFENVNDDDNDDENDDNEKTNAKPVGGITRVLQGGNVIEKGACSFTLIGQAVLTKERAATIRARQQSATTIAEGDEYAAAALSMVLHSKCPHVPTFRSDVRVFLVKPRNDDNSDDKNSQPRPTLAWFGGGADLTPYYLNADDITAFHQDYAKLCEQHDGMSYPEMKQACDDYFYLPARQEHRGTGGIFFDDLDMTRSSLSFVEGVVRSWMPSWMPIVQRRQKEPFTEQQRHWQLLRRGRYLEFNLLYDRGVRFGLANANPRVEGVMVSAPPLIAFDYNHPIVDGSPEAELLEVLKHPKDWV